MIRTLILDDEPHWQLVLRRMVESHQDMEISGIFGSPLEALPAIKKGEHDLILLDVEFAEINGIEFAKSLENPPLVIFVTTHDRFAVKSYEVEAIDFLVKPVHIDRFNQAIQKVQKRMLKDAESTDDAAEADIYPLENNFFFIKENQGYVKVHLDQILFVKSLENYIQIVLPNSTYTILGSLNFIESKLGNQFMRIHRSYLVNLNRIDSFTNETITVGSYDLPLGGQYQEQFRQDFMYRNLLKK